MQLAYRVRLFGYAPEPIKKLVTPLRGSPFINKTCYPALEDLLRARSCGTAEEGRSLACLERALDPLCFLRRASHQHAWGAGLDHSSRHQGTGREGISIQRQPRPSRDSAFEGSGFQPVPTLFYRRPRPCT